MGMITLAQKRLEKIAEFDCMGMITLGMNRPGCDSQLN